MEIQTIVYTVFLFVGILMCIEKFYSIRTNINQSKFWKELNTLAGNSKTERTTNLFFNAEVTQATSPGGK